MCIFQLMLKVKRGEISLEDAKSLWEHINGNTKERDLPKKDGEDKECKNLRQEQASFSEGKEFRECGA